jgi:HEPN domain-containing protein
MKDPVAEAARWLKQAQYDLEVAKYNAEGQFYATACFSAQQSAEKALKAFLFRLRKSSREKHRPSPMSSSR